MVMLKNVFACETSSVRGLSEQLIAEIQRIRPNLLVRFDDLNVSIDEDKFPLLQPTAKEALRRAIQARGTTLTVTSAYRTIAQQYLLYKQYQEDRCGIALAAKPGRSNHETGLALDIQDYDNWKRYFRDRNWRWLGDRDPVHFDFQGGRRDISGISVLAFQRLWNRNNLNDQIGEDGIYGPDTEKRLGESPAEGFGNAADDGTPRVLRLSLPLMQGGDVRQVQLALKRAGFDIDVDSIYGPATESAIKQFQENKGLDVDGRVGPQTRAALGLSAN